MHPPVDNAWLSAPVLSGVGVGRFDRDTLAYTVSAKDATAQTTVTATPADPAVTMGIDPADADTNTDGYPIALSVGTNTITVTDRGGTVRIDRAPTSN